MLSSIHRSQSNKRKQRPYSALTVTSHRTQYRLPDNESLNSIRSNIHQTFQIQTRELKEVKHLTERLDPKYSKRMDRLCQQFNIAPNPKRRSLSGNVDVQFIARRYILNKSKEKKKQQEKEILKKEVNKVVNRFSPKTPRSFFQFDVDTLRQMEYKSKSKSTLNSSRQHPYLEMYEQSQVEALACLSQHNQLNLDKIGIYADMVQPDDWERYQKDVKRIYSGVRSLRRDRNQNSPYMKRGPTSDPFFIT